MLSLDQPATSFFLSEEHSEGWFSSSSSIFCCQFDLKAYQDIYFAHYQIYLPESIQKAVNKRKAEFLAGRFCAKRALAPIIGYPVDIGIGLDRNPLWPANIKGSISHSNTNAIAVVTNSATITGVGIDIENKISANTINNIRSQIVFRDEVKLFINSKLDYATLFTIIFSIKESFFKAAYPTVKRYFDFDTVTVLRIDLNTKKILFKLNCDLHETLKAGLLLTGEFHLIDQDRLSTLVTLPQVAILP